VALLLQLLPPLLLLIPGACIEQLDMPGTGNAVVDTITQFVWPISTICSSDCILGNASATASGAAATQLSTMGWDNSACVECVPWGGTGQLSPLTAALFAAASFGGAEYCYSGFWMLCGVKGGAFLVVFGGAIVYRLQGVRGNVLLHALLMLLAMALLAWDILDVMAILDWFGGDSGWTFGREACGKPFLNPASVATQPFGAGWFVDDMQHCAAGFFRAGNLTSNATGVDAATAESCCSLVF
jgi:hypothetical protein